MAGKKKPPKKLRSVNTSTKFTGIICASFTAVQAVVCITLALIGIICFFVDCGAETKSFDSSARISMLSPAIVFLHVIILHLCLSIVWLLASIYVIYRFMQWTEYSKIKKAGNIWMIITALVCLFDFILFIIFLTDVTVTYISTDHPITPPGKGRPPAKTTTTSTTTTTTTTESDTESDDQAFFRKKTWETVPWPSKNKSKIKEKRASEIIFPLIEDDVKLMPNVQVILRHTLKDDVKLIKILNQDSISTGSPLAPQLKKNIQITNGEAEIAINQLKEEVSPNKMSSFRFKRDKKAIHDIILSPVICMIVALKGFIPWIANILLLHYFSEKMKNFQMKKTKEGFFKKICCWRRKATKGKSRKRKSTKRKSIKRKSTKRKSKKKKVKKRKPKKKIGKKKK